MTSIPNILVLCTGNSCRSQMLHGYLQELLGARANVFSAGLEASGISPLAVRVMNEDGISIAHHTSDTVGEYLSFSFAHVLTVCDDAYSLHPLIAARAHQHYRAFPDPAQTRGTIAERLVQFRIVRDQLKSYAQHFVGKEFTTLVSPNRQQHMLVA
jgi:arsenate reductase (thioredoxin)